MEAGSGAGVTINPVAFLIINKENIKLMPINHSSTIDKLIDYIPDILSKIPPKENNNQKNEEKANVNADVKVEVQKDNNIDSDYLEDE